jgi:hypothetical protein
MGDVRPDRPRDARRRSARGLLAGLLAAGAAAAGLAASPPARAQADERWDLARLLAEIARQDTSSRRFVERRFVGALDAPVDASGELRFVKPSRLEKRTLKPRPETLVLDGDRLEVDGPAGRRTLSLQQVPEAAALVESLRATLSGDRVGLERAFTVALQGTAAHWTLRLVPRDPRAARLVKEVRVAGQRGELDLVEIDQVDGDQSVMRVLR